MGWRRRGRGRRNSESHESLVGFLLMMDFMANVDWLLYEYEFGVA